MSKPLKIYTRLKKLSLSACFILTGCTSLPDVSVVDISFLPEEKEFSYKDSHVKARGKLVALIEAEQDLIDYVEKNELNLWYEVKECKTGTELQGWPFFYRNPNSEKYQYFVMFDYKKADDSEQYYDLVKNSRELCFVVGAGGVFGISSSKSNSIRVVLQDSLLEEISKFENEDGVVSFELSEDCKNQMCRPSYSY